MQEQCPLVPDGISHDIDLSALTPEALDAHHLKGLRLAGFLHGATGQSEYRQRHPEAAHLRGTVNALAYSPKPQGYDAAIVDRVTQWLASDAALAATNRADVDSLNAALGTTRFNSANHFSKALSPSLLAKVASVCAGHAIVIQTRPGMTMGQLRQSIRAARSLRKADAQPFGNVGSRTGNILTIGGRAFTVGKHSDRECIRVTVRGVTQRVSLDSLAAICGGLVDSAGAGTSSEYLLHSNTGELVPRHNSTDGEQGAPIGRTCPADVGPPADPIGRTCPAADPINPEPLSLSDKIRGLAAARQGQATADTSATADGPDPLEIDPLEL